MPDIEDALLRYYEREMSQRAGRPLGEEREARLAAFVTLCQRDGLSAVVEVGCGAGRDGSVLHAAGLAYKGLDVAPASVAICSHLLGVSLLTAARRAAPLPDLADVRMPARVPIGAPTRGALREPTSLREPAPPRKEVSFASGRGVCGGVD